MELYSTTLERRVLGGLIKYPSLILESRKYISQKDFYHEVHSTIYSVILSFKDDGLSLDKFAISQKLQTLGITSKDDLKIEDYVETLDFTQITEDVLVDQLKILNSLAEKRRLKSELTELHKSITYDAKIATVLIDAQRFIDEKIDKLNISKPVSLADIRNFSNKYKKVPWFSSSNISFDNTFGGFRTSSIYTFISGFDCSPDIFLANFFIETLKKDIKTKILHLDVNKSSYDIETLIISQLNKVSQKTIDLSEIKINDNSFHGENYHFYNIKNKNIKDLLFIIKLWLKKNITSEFPIILISGIKGDEEISLFKKLVKNNRILLFLDIKETQIKDFNSLYNNSFYVLHFKYLIGEGLEEGVTINKWQNDNKIVKIIFNNGPTN